MRLKSIASGSSGNCIYVGSDATHFLVDVGISGKKVELGLNELDLTSSDIDAILITHEHSDHIGGLGVISRKCKIPIYATKGTLMEIAHCSSLGAIDVGLFNEIEYDTKYRIKDMDFVPLKTSHDAKMPTAYKFYSENKKAAIMTDLGTFDEYIVDSLNELDAIYLEANHDVRMLQTGAYPYYLKQRILGNKGHLSNETSGKLLSRILHDNMQAVVLSHLSKENNLPALAYEAVRMEVTMGDNPYRADDFNIMVADRFAPSETINL